MADEDKESKTEEPSEKKRDDAFKKGRTASSKEVNSTIVLFVAACLLYATGEYMRVKMSVMMATSFATASEYELTVASIRPLAIHYISIMGITLAPLGFSIMLAGLISNIAQNGGLILSAEPIMPKFNKLDPIKGFGRFVGKQAFMELFKSLFKIGIVGTVCYQVVKSEWTTIPSLADKSIEQILVFVAWVAIKLIMYTLLIMIVMAVADLIFQKHVFEESLKMSKQEVKDERKNSDGNPITKQRIRTAQMNMARKRMMSDVPKAEVVITNPTHLAIAIAYDRGEMNAPVVVAKGAGLVAEKIKAVAKENDIPIVEDKPLARILFKSIDIGRAIPEELYKAIAEILAYVYKLKAKIH